ncbi:UPF0149 family protein [Neisseriaceae bacterium TC5R-5]|nr:UPF0149 family protein [Neisseriaceae bacterium TC5R-5]
MKQQALSDGDYQRLATTLQRLHTQQCMNLEQVDGFFAGLLCGPEIVKPVECLPIILGNAFDDDRAFASEKTLEQFVRLLTGHWLDIAASLHKGGEFMPWLEADAQGLIRANDWAEGFAMAMELMPEDWDLLFDSAEHAPLLEPILRLAFERQENPELQGEVVEINEQQRQQYLAEIPAAVQGVYQFFAAIRQSMVDEEDGRE